MHFSLFEMFFLSYCLFVFYAIHIHVTTLNSVTVFLCSFRQVLYHLSAFVSILFSKGLINFAQAGLDL
jgi:hypothetical protein